MYINICSINIPYIFKKSTEYGNYINIYIYIYIYINNIHIYIYIYIYIYICYISSLN